MAEMLRSLELRQYVVSTDRRPADVSNRTADSDQAADQQDKPRASSIRAIAGPSKVKDPLVLLVTAPRRQRQDAARVCLEVAASRHVRAQAQGASASVTGLRGAGRRTSDCGTGSGSGLRSDRGRASHELEQIRRGHDRTACQPRSLRDRARAVRLSTTRSLTISGRTRVLPSSPLASSAARRSMSIAASSRHACSAQLSCQSP
jgi:hypothetical protein